MEFRRITGLPPYVFAQINGLKADARAHGRDVIDFGFGNPDLPSPDVAVEKLAEAAHNPKNHRYSASRGIPNLRLAIANRYKSSLTSISIPILKSSQPSAPKEGFTHLMWVLLGPGDTASCRARAIRSTSPGRALRAAKSSPCRCWIPAPAPTIPGEDFFAGCSTRGSTPGRNLA